MIRGTSLIILSLWCSMANGFVFFTKPCNTSLTGIQQFDINKFLGTWYEGQRYAMMESQIKDKCVNIEFSNYINGTFAANVTKISGIRGTVQKYSGTATFLEGPSVGKFDIAFQSRFFRTISYSSTYLVLGTDYTNYAVVYTCNKSSFVGSLQTVFMYYRTPVPSQSSINMALQVLDNYELSRTPLASTAQDNCN